MCWTCFKKYTDKPVVNDRVVAVYRLIAERADEVASSALLHIIVADMNVDDWLFDLADPNRRQRYDEASDWERAIFDRLAALSEPERATAVAMEWGYIRPDGTLRSDLREEVAAGRW